MPHWLVFALQFCGWVAVGWVVCEIISIPSILRDIRAELKIMNNRPGNGRVHHSE